MQHTQSPPHLSLRLLCLGAFALAAHPATAQESAEPRPLLSISGYATAGVVHKSDRQSDFVSSLFNANGAGATRATSVTPDSRVGVQLSVQSGPWSGVVQLVSEQQITNTWRPAAEWAYVKYQATPDLALRLGRIALPMFLAADYRKVGYAYPWVRTPVEVYGAIPMTNSDGVDLAWRWSSGAVKHVTQVLYGRNNQKASEDSRLQVRRLAGFAHTATWGAATARLSYLTTELTVDLAQSGFQIYRALGPEGAAIADRWDVDHKRADGVSLGLAYDPGAWFAQGEIGRMNTRSYLGDRSVLYLAGGLRRGDFTPFASLAAARPNGATYEPGIPLAQLPPAARPTAAYLTGELNNILRYIPSQHTITLGLRWDVADSVDLKFQLDRVRPHGSSYGTLIHIQPGFVPGQAVHVASAAVDVVF